MCVVQVDNALPPEPAGDNSPQGGKNSRFYRILLAGITLTWTITMYFVLICLLVQFLIIVHFYRTIPRLSRVLHKGIKESSCSSQGMDIMLYIENMIVCVYAVREFTKDELKITTNSFSAKRRWRIWDCL